MYFLISFSLISDFGMGQTSEQKQRLFSIRLQTFLGRPAQCEKKGTTAGKVVKSFPPAVVGSGEERVRQAPPAFIPSLNARHALMLHGELVNQP
jgi:hypothetical protein